MEDERYACTDCGITVTYDNAGFWPWKGVDGSVTCKGNDERVTTYNFGHRLWRWDADKVFAAYQRATGRKARHNI